tara:strand:- start:12595 stop:12714 length:120 start_codon:yes stop_codon:yes gene_type:complete
LSGYCGRGSRGRSHSILFALFVLVLFFFLLFFYLVLVLF